MTAPIMTIPEEVYILLITIFSLNRNLYKYIVSLYLCKINTEQSILLLFHRQQSFQHVVLYTLTARPEESLLTGAVGCNLSGEAAPRSRSNFDSESTWASLRPLTALALFEHIVYCAYQSLDRRYNNIVVHTCSPEASLILGYYLHIGNRLGSRADLL